MTKFLTQEWGYFSLSKQTLFSVLAQSLNSSPYHAWLKLNSNRWTSNFLPIQDPTNTDEHSLGIGGAFIQKTGRVHNLLASWKGLATFDGICQTTFSNKPGYSPSKLNTKIITSTTYILEDYMIFNGFWIAPDDDHYPAYARCSIPSGDSNPFVSLPEI